MNFMPFEETQFNFHDLVIFEGCDCSGKTTIAKKFADMHNFDYRHFDAALFVKTPPEFYGFFRSALDDIYTSGRPTVFDRCWLSERPYHSSFRANTPERYTSTLLRRLDIRALAFGAVVVYCDPGFEKIEEEFLKRQDNEYLDNVDQLRKTYEYYKLVSTHIPVVKFDYTKDTVEDLSERIACTEYGYAKYCLPQWVK